MIPFLVIKSFLYTALLLYEVYQVYLLFNVIRISGRYSDDLLLARD